jgi:hypothetical protein
MSDKVARYEFHQSIAIVIRFLGGYDWKSDGSSLCGCDGLISSRLYFRFDGSRIRGRCHFGNIVPGVYASAGKTVEVVLAHRLHLGGR